MINIKIINLKLNFSRLLIVFSIIIATLFIFFAMIRLFNMNTSNIITLTNENYTTILNDSHNNIEKYLNKDFSFTGYIFRLEDFNENQFIVARDMLVSDSKAQIVGFLCSYENAKEFAENSWVEVKGTLTKGNYRGEMPIISVKKITKITTPNEVFVYPPK